MVQRSPGTGAEREYERQIAETYHDLVACGLITPGRRQKVNMALVAEFLRCRGGSPAEDGLTLLTRLQDDLDEDGFAEVTPEFVLLMDERMMELAVEEAAAQMETDDEDPLGQGVGLVLAGRFPEAIRAFNAAIESNRYGPEAYSHRGRAFQLAGDNRLAILDFDRYLASGVLWRRPTTLGWRAEALVSEKQSAEAIQSLEDAVVAVGAQYDLLCQTDRTDEEILEGVLVELRAVIGIAERVDKRLGEASDVQAGMAMIRDAISQTRRRLERR
ncbi:MAG: hypothetical protein R6X20_10450 [Phycisphaerae bacterium]